MTVCLNRLVNALNFAQLMHSIRALICSMYDFEIISLSNDHYTYDDLCTARMHIGIRKVFECVEPYDLDENYSAA